MEMDGTNPLLNGHWFDSRPNFIIVWVKIQTTRIKIGFKDFPEKEKQLGRITIGFKDFVEKEKQLGRRVMGLLPLQMALIGFYPPLPRLNRKTCLEF